MVRLFCVTSCLFVLAPFAAADVLDVGGPNPDAISISAAVEMALDGDVIRVWSASAAYGSFTVDGKSLSIVPEDAAGHIDISGVVRVLNLPPTAAVEIVGLRGPLFGQGGGSKLIAHNNQGAVRFTDSQFRIGGGSAYPFTETSTDIVACENITFVDCTFTGQPGTSGWSGQMPDGTRAVTLENSRAAFYECLLTGGNGGDAMFGSLLNPGYGGDGAHALELEGTGDLFLSDCTVQGGTGGTNDQVTVFGSAPNGYSIQGTSADFDVRYLASQRVGATVLPSPSTQSWIFGRPLVLSGDTWVQDTDTLDVKVTGDIGALVGVYFSTGYGDNFAAVGGPLLVHVPGGPNRPMWRFLGRIGLNREVTDSIPLRDLPAYAHVKLHLTAASVSSLGRKNSNSMSPLILDSAW